MPIFLVPILVISAIGDMLLGYSNLAPYLYILATAVYFHTENKHSGILVVAVSAILIITASIGFWETQDATIVISRTVALIAIILLHQSAIKLRLVKAHSQNISKQQITLLDSLSDGMIITDKLGAIQYMNPVAEALTCCNLDQAKKAPLSRVFTLVDEKTKSPIGNPVDTVLRSKRRTSMRDNVLLRGNKPHEMIVEHMAIPITSNDKEMQGAAIIFRDLSASREISKQLSYHTCHDSVTGLLNRTEFERRLQRMISACNDEETQHVLFYLDLQEFRMVVNNCGTEAGDDLLKQVSHLFQTKMRKRDTLARLGADEFGIILEHCSLDKAHIVANQLNQLIQGYRFPWGGKIFSVGLSSGLVQIDTSTKSLEWALSLASHACDLAQSSGRNVVHTIDPANSNQEDLPSESTWVHRITQALKHGKFELFTQKISPIGTQYVNDNFIELCVSMLDEDGNTVPAGAFLPIATRYGLQSDIDQWVISTLITELTSNTVLVKKTGGFCVNICPQSVSEPDYYNCLKEQLAWSNVPADKICIEISESAAFRNIGDTNVFIQKVRELGCKVSLDQYGSGISTFAQLKSLPVDYVKIDGSYIKSMNSDRIDSTMVESINQIAHMLGFETIATYCENELTYKHLKRIGVDYVQGFHIEKPAKLQSHTVTKVA